ncbi:MAG: hypothetical protein KDJ31_00005, partial [Candidatus Competibacteraceae bacterium]|nr:hypothetical protein [Candidatus Competibacteraceae bacterium]
LVHIEQGLLTVPDHPELLALRKQVKTRLAEQQRQADEEARQRREAEARWQAEEAERRKTEKIRLQTAAEQRWQEAAQHLAQAVEAQRKGEYAASAELIDQGLTVAPDHGGLLRLRQEVEHGIAEEKARQEREAAQRLQAEQFLAQAQNHFTEGTLEISLAHVEQGLLVVPDHPELLALREQVKTRIAEQARQQAEAVKRQQEEAAQQQTTETERQKVEQARQQAELAQRRKETDQYLTRAVELQNKGEQTASLQQIEEGLALIPDHEGLTRLRHKVSTEIVAQQRQQAEQEQREREITNLLEQAEVHMKAWRLTTPVGNNAEETYQQVLKLDVGNVEALAGLKRIAEGYLQMAQKRRSAGMLSDSLTFIEKGLEVIPNHAELLRLREEVRAKGSEVQQRLEQQQLDRQKEKTKRQDRTATVQPPTQAIPQAKRKLATAKANAAKNRRCDSILSRLTLGESVSNEDHIFMTKECR